jgi:hypothetical protein
VATTTGVAAKIQHDFKAHSTAKNEPEDRKAPNAMTATHRHLGKRKSDMRRIRRKPVF